MPFEADREAIPHISEQQAPRSVGFLISQLGLASARNFMTALQPVGIDPREWTLMRFVGASEGQSQQALADRLGIPPSRMVAIVDGLEERGLMERRPDPADRRVRGLYLTRKGSGVLERAIEAAIQVETDLCADLSDAERDELIDLLQRLQAGDIGARPGVHLGMRLEHPSEAPES